MSANGDGGCAGFRYMRTHTTRRFLGNRNAIKAIWRIPQGCATNRNVNMPRPKYSCVLVLFLKSLLSFSLYLKQMQSTRHTRMFWIFYSVLLLNSTRPEMGMGLQIVPKCILLQNYSVAWLCFEGALDYLTEGFLPQWAAQVGPVWGTVLPIGLQSSEKPTLTLNNEVCKEQKQSVCKESLADSSIWWIFFSHCWVVGLQLRLLSLSFGVQVLSCFCLGMLQI